MADSTRWCAVRSVALASLVVLSLVAAVPGAGTVGTQTDSVVADTAIESASQETQEPVDVTIDKATRTANGSVDVIVRFAGTESSNLAALKSHAKQAQQPIETLASNKDGVEVRSQFWLTNAVVVTVDTEVVPVRRLAAVPGVVEIRENAEVRIDKPVTPADTSAASAAATGGAGATSSYDTTYGVEQVNAPDVWAEYDTQGENVRVAVLDTGIDADHPDLDLYTEDESDPTYPGGWADCSGYSCDGNTEPFDSTTHGTHVSGTVSGGNASGTYMGVAPNVELMHGMVMEDGGGTSSEILNGMQWAVENGADVITMSFGSETYSSSYIDAIRNAQAQGVTVVASVGNSFEGTSISPGNGYDSIGVGATTGGEAVPGFSSGELIDTSADWGSSAPADWPEGYIVPSVVAPGRWVNSTEPGNDYRWASGTSMAAPHVAGVVALVESATTSDPSPAEITEALQETAWKPDSWDESNAEDAIAEQDTRYGHGIVDAYAAIQYLEESSQPSATFAVSGLDTTGPVEGDALAVEFSVENTGDAEGTQTLELTTDPALGTNTTSVTLNAGESTVGTLSVATSSGDAGTYTATVTSANDSDSMGVTVLESAYFGVNITGTTAPVVEGDSLSVEATIENTGDTSDTQTVTLNAGSLGGDSMSVSLAGGASMGVTLSASAGDGDAGDYTATVASADESDSTGVRVDAPANVAVSIDSVTAPVVEGEALSVAATITNTGDIGDTQTVTLDAGPLGSDSTSVSLAGGASAAVTLSVDTRSGDAGDYTATVASANDTDSTAVTVQEPGYLAVSITGTSAPIVEGDSLSVEATIENTGDVGDTQTVTLDAGSIGSDATSVSLAGGESTTETFTVATTGGDAGAYTATVASANDTDSTAVTVQESAYLAVNITGTTAPVVAGEALSVEATVENTGDVSDTQTLTLDAGPLGTDSVSVSLAGGNLTTETFTLSTNGSDAGDYTATVASADDTDSTGVTLQAPAQFAVSITATSSPVVAGEALSVEATVENAGDVSGTQTVTLDAGSLGTDGTSVSLAGGESTVVSLTVDASSGDAGTYAVTVASADDTDSTTITVQEPASFAVSIAGTSSPVVAGDVLSVEATVENTGDVSDTQTVTLDVGTLGVDSGAVSLNGGESTTTILAVSTSNGDVGDYTATIASADNTDSTGVTVQAPAQFAVSITATSSPVVAGEALSVEATVENTGDVSDTQTVTLDVGSLGSDSVSVSLAGNSTTTETLSVATTSGDASTYTATVSSADDAGSAAVTVQKPGVLVVDITGTDTPIVAGETLSVEATVENTGDVTDTQTVTLDVGSLGSDATSVSLDGGESTTETFTLSTASGDDGSYTATVTSEDSTDSTGVTVQEPGALAVGITGTNAPVVAGETLSVEATVENTGDVSDTQTITLDAGGLGSDSTTVSLNGNGSTVVSLSVATAGGDAGSYTATVASEDSTDTTGVTVQAPAQFAVSIASSSSPVVEGETLTVEASVANTGDVGDTQAITLGAGGLGTDSVAVSLSGGESTAVTLSVATGSGDAGTYTPTVSSTDDTDSTAVTVQEPAHVAVSITGTNAPVVAGETLTVDATVENTGDIADTQTITLDAGSLGTDSTTVSLGGGESATVALSVGTGSDDAGNYSATVTSADDAGSTGVTVQAPAQFAVNIAGTDSPVVAGDPLSVEATVENTGDVSGTQTVTLDVGTLGDTSTAVTLTGGAAVTETLSLATGTGDAGTYTATIETADETASTAVTVLEPAAFTVDIVGTTGPVAGDRLAVTAAVDNAGDVSGTETVTLDVAGLGQNSTAVSLDGGETVEQTLSVDTTAGDAGTYAATVSSDTDDDVVNVTVQSSGGGVALVDVVTSAAIVEGDPLAVNVTVENTDNTAATGQITVDGGSLGNTSATVALDAGQTSTTTVVLETETGADSLGTRTLSVGVSNDSVERSVQVHLPMLRGGDRPPQDLDGDGTFEDVDGDGVFDISDVYTLYSNIRTPAVQDHGWAFDFNGDGTVDTYDVWVLVSRLY